MKNIVFTLFLLSFFHTYGSEHFYKSKSLSSIPEETEENNTSKPTVFIDKFYVLYTQQVMSSINCTKSKTNIFQNISAADQEIIRKQQEAFDRTHPDTPQPIQAQKENSVTINDSQ